MLTKKGSTIIESATQDGNRACVTVEYPHHEIHEGNTYRVCKLVEDVANDASFIYLIKVGAKYSHLTANLSCEGKCYAYFYEAPTTSADGTALAEINMNRASTKTNTTNVFYAPTVSDNGIPLCEILINGGTGPQSIGSEVRQDTEFVMKPNTNYLIVCTNKAGLAKDINVNVQWYEESAI